MYSNWANEMMNTIMKKKRKTKWKSEGMRAKWTPEKQRVR